MLLFHARLRDDISQLIGQLGNLPRVLLDVLERLIADPPVALMLPPLLASSRDTRVAAGCPSPASRVCTRGHARSTG
jgi:hypothetical protein